MIQEKDFEVYIDKDNRMVFAIGAKEGNPTCPKMCYDGGEHAVLYRDETTDSAVVLDYLSSKTQEWLKQSSRVMVAEIDYDNEQIVRDYDIPVEMVSQLPDLILEKE